MRLYTVQPRFVYDTLCNTGIFLSQPWKDGDNWICTDAPAIRLAYDWLCEEMVDRGLRRPGDSVYPIWAWYQYMGKQKPKPDLRYSDMKHYAQTGRHVLLSLDIPDENVLLHDYDAWHYPLNYFYLAPQRAGGRFEHQCKAAGFPLYDIVPLQNAALHEEVQRSWQAVFDLPRSRRLLGIPQANQAIQATFWVLHARDVSAVVEFGHGAKLRPLPLPKPKIAE